MISSLLKHNYISKNISAVVLTTARLFSNENQANPLNSQSWDIIISGGGMVGCALSCALGSSNVFSGSKILLLETSKTTNYSVSPNKYSNRVCALNPGSKALFESFGAWKKMCDIRVKEVKKMQVWESCSDARIIFENAGMTVDVAYIVENDVILKALNECLSDLQGNIQVLRNAKAINYELPKAHDCENHVTVQLQDGQILKTKLLIGADGVNSTVRKIMGVKYVNWNYNQKGIVATLKLSELTENVVAWQRFLPSGPIALLPLSDDLCSLVWTVSLSMAEKLLEISDEEFVDALNSALWDDANKNPLAESALSGLNSILSTIFPGKGSVRQLPPSILSIEPSSRAAFPLGLGHATEYVAPGVALIGDAAHRVHPLAGQGVNLGFGDVQCLVKCLETSVYNGNDIGTLDPLLEYEVERQRHVVPAMVAIDALNRLYKTEFTPLVVLRSLGVTLFDSCSWLKERTMKQASA